MAPRLLFALVLYPDLPAAEVVREDSFEDQQGLSSDGTGPTGTGQTRNVRIADKSGSDPVSIPGKILKIGTKTHLSKLRVLRDGTVLPSGAEVPNGDILCSRKQTLADRARRVIHARELHLQNIDEILINEGPDALPLPPPKPIKSKALKSRPAAYLQELAQKLQNLKCYEKNGTQPKVTLSEKPYIAISVLQHHWLKFTFAKSPVSMFRVLVRLLVGDELLSSPGIGVIGGRGCVALSSILLLHAKAYVDKYSTGKNFDWRRTVQNLLQELKNGRHLIHIPTFPEEEQPEDQVVSVTLNSYSSTSTTSTESQTSAEQTEYRNVNGDHHPMDFVADHNPPSTMLPHLQELTPVNVENFSIVHEGTLSFMQL